MNSIAKSDCELTFQRVLPAKGRFPASFWVERVSKGEVIAHHQRYQRVTPQELEQMDQALALVQGSFLAAAKLLDMDPQRFRNLVNYHPRLKAKWGRHRGRQPRLSFNLRFP